MVLLIDLDGVTGRLVEAKSKIPAHLAGRVFILGARNESEDLKRAGLGSFETIGRAWATDCRQETSTTWGHPELQHNAGEVQRLGQAVAPFLFWP